MAFKLVELNNMAAYLDTDAEMIGHLGIEQIRVGSKLINYIYCYKNLIKIFHNLKFKK